MTVTNATNAPEWHAEAQRLAAEGVPVRRIAKQCGRSVTATYAALDPETSRERRRESKAQYERMKTERRRQERKARLDTDPGIPGLLPIYHGDHIIDMTRVDLDVWEAMRGTRLNFSGKGYPTFWVKAKRRQIYLHHLVLGVIPARGSGLVTDHINRDPTDNRRQNLRLVTQKENCANRGGIFAKGCVKVLSRG